MYTTLLITAALAVTSSLGQFRNPQNPREAAILSEARYLSGDGTFGAAYVQEDGVEFKEESDGEGNRRGQYSYVGPDGQRRTVQYTAGKNGFMATGDHIPQAPVPVAPTPGYTPLPQYNSPDANQYNPPPQQYNPPPQQYNPPPQQYNPPPQQYNPPPQQYNPPPQQYRPTPAPYRQPNNQYNPQYNSYSTTPSPHRFFPPGKLNLNRTPDGFSYTFNKS
ncbi:endocuticle structural glycoprotein SgAbd-2-like [Hetaerina americana]|uniref:endocuticle structural glycoprotein SgAbd-2-like n=1 Tax=Hetaerina americana TaxID=62018 RepID=UPI003A7F4137